MGWATPGRRKNLPVLGGTEERECFPQVDIPSVLESSMEKARMFAKVKGRVRCGQIFALPQLEETDC